MTEIQREHDNLLNAIPVVSLCQHDLFCYEWSLLDSAETNDIRETRVRLFITVGHTHTATDCDIEALQFTIRIDNRDKT